MTIPLPRSTAALERIAVVDTHDGDPTAPSHGPHSGSTTKMAEAAELSRGGQGDSRIAQGGLPQ